MLGSKNIFTDPDYNALATQLNPAIKRVFRAFIVELPSFR